MRTVRTHYEILGLPRDATVAQIKRRYRQLVRKYHPDVAVQKASAHTLFLQITQAYEVLTDPVRRRAYDATLDLERRSAAQAPPRTTTQTRSRPQPTPSAQVARHIRDAQWAFIQRRLDRAMNHCREALRADPRCARAHAILGDIYRAQGNMAAAVRAYSYAVQYNPRDRDSEKKLIALASRGIRRQTRAVPRPAGPASRAAAAGVWWSIAIFTILLIGVSPGKPIPWLAYYIPPISLWSWNLVLLMMAASAVVGLVLSTSGFLSHPDEEIIFQNTSGNWAVVPTGIILLLGSGFFFLGAAVFYVVVGIIQGSLSRSVMTVFAAVLLIVTLSALVYKPEARQQVLLFGGNISFLPMLAGWYFGTTLKPLGDIRG